MTAFEARFGISSTTFSANFAKVERARFPVSMTWLWRKTILATPVIKSSTWRLSRWYYSVFSSWSSVFQSERVPISSTIRTQVDIKSSLLTAKLLFKMFPRIACTLVSLMTLERYSWPLAATFAYRWRTRESTFMSYSAGWLVSALIFWLWFSNLSTWCSIWLLPSLKSYSIDANSPFCGIAWTTTLLLRKSCISSVSHMDRLMRIQSASSLRK